MRTLSFDVGGAGFGGAFEDRHRILEGERFRDQELQVDLAGCHQIERAVEHIGIAKDRLDPDLLGLCRDDIERCLVGWHADKQDRSSG